MTAADILVIGDRYLPSAVLGVGLDALGDRVVVRTADISRTDTPALPSTVGLAEYAGDPQAVVDALGASCDVLVVHGAPVTDEVLATPGLALVCCARGGPVNVDLVAATAREIPVTGAPGKNATAVAELTIAFALDLIRGIAPAAGFLRAGRSLASVFDGARFFGAECSDVTLGLVGLGRVGREVAVRARALGMRVVAHDPYARTAVDGVDLLADLDAVLATADIVSLHARAGAANRHLIGERELAIVRAGGYLINTARESLVDEGALLAALRSGHLAGAAVDVLEIGDGRNPLLDEPSVLVTPHIGGATDATARRGAEMVAAAVAAHLDGRPLPFLCNPDLADRSTTTRRRVLS